MALKQARTLAQYKAASQNLMHGSLAITDGIYGVLSTGDVGEQIAGLTNGGNGNGSDPAVLRELQEIKRLLTNRQ